MRAKLKKLDLRIPKWQKLENRVCPICKLSNKPKWERPDHTLVSECKQCKLKYTCFSPNYKSLEKFYFEYEKHYVNYINTPTNQDIFKFWAETLPSQKNYFVKLAKNFITIKGSKVLDFGCSNGLLLSAFKNEGANCYGVDVDPKAFYLAKKVIGKNRIFRNLEDLECSQQKCFDMIMMIDLIEHPLDPVELTKKLSKLLKPNGVMLFHTPNGDFIDVDKELTTLRVDLEHMQFFNIESLLNFSKTLNMSIIYANKYGYPSLEKITNPEILISNKKKQKSKVELKANIKFLFLSIIRFLKLGILIQVTKKLKQKHNTPNIGVEYHLDFILKKK